MMNLCETCRFSISRKCPIGVKVNCGEAANLILREWGFYNNRKNIKGPTIDIGISECDIYEKHPHIE